jgi:hypothetical protein
MRRSEDEQAQPALMDGEEARKGWKAAGVPIGQAQGGAA